MSWILAGNPDAVETQHAKTALDLSHVHFRFLPVEDEPLQLFNGLRDFTGLEQIYRLCGCGANHHE